MLTITLERIAQRFDSQCVSRRLPRFLMGLMGGFLRQNLMAGILPRQAGPLLSSGAPLRLLRLCDTPSPPWTPHGEKVLWDQAFPHLASTTFHEAPSPSNSARVYQSVALPLSGFHHPLQSRLATSNRVLSGKIRFMEVVSDRLITGGRCRVLENLRKP